MMFKATSIFLFITLSESAISETYRLDPFATFRPFKTPCKGALVGLKKIKDAYEAKNFINCVLEIEKLKVDEFWEKGEAAEAYGIYLKALLDMAESGGRDKAVERPDGLLFRPYLRYELEVAQLSQIVNTGYEGGRLGETAIAAFRVEEDRKIRSGISEEDIFASYAKDARQTPIIVDGWNSLPSIHLLMLADFCSRRNVKREAVRKLIVDLLLRSPKNRQVSNGISLAVIRILNRWTRLQLSAEELVTQLTIRMKNAGPQVDRALIHICLGELYRYIASKHYVRAISLPKKQVKELGRFTLELNRSDTGLVVHGYGHKSLEKYGISEFVDLRFEGMVQRIRN